MSSAENDPQPGDAGAEEDRAGRFDTGQESVPEDHTSAKRFSEGEEDPADAAEDAVEGDFATGEHDDGEHTPDVHGDFATGEHDE
jgi:hypothetical protein